MVDAVTPNCVDSSSTLASPLDRASRTISARRACDPRTGKSLSFDSRCAACQFGGLPKSFDLDFERPKSIGRMRGFQGNFGVFVRSYAYILSLGADGLAEASETAVLNANYLKARLAEGRAGQRLPIAFDRHCMHEFVLSGKPMKKELGLATLDLAKRLLDYGFHPPTVYFPLLVDEALMVEPTETETKESLDAFADAVEQILAEGEQDPEVAKQAPYSTPVRRLDEVRATRKPVVRQRFGDDSPAE